MFAMCGVVVLIVALVNLVPADAGCVHAGLCCLGKNNTCRADGPRINNPDSTSCFCDTDCAMMGDCCIDQQIQCRKIADKVRAIDCVVTDGWNDWSDCDTRCGFGVKQRTRNILVHPLNGGQLCPPTVEKMACEGMNCKVPRTPGGLEDIRETGKIIPAMFGSCRQNKLYSPFQDIRKNLFEHYEMNTIEQRPSYCAKYEVTETRALCQSAVPTVGEWPRRLVKGSVLCVECQGTAMKAKLGGRCRGHGLFHRETRWSAVTIPGCHGKWVLRSSHEQCQCDAESDLSFILV